MLCKRPNMKEDQIMRHRKAGRISGVMKKTSLSTFLLIVAFLLLGGVEALASLEMTASPTSGSAPLTVNFTASGNPANSSSGCTPESYAWDFGDGGTSSSQNPSYTYNSAGTYTATVTFTVVRKSGGVCQTLVQTASKTITVSGSPPPPPPHLRHPR
jgi:PKD repeat protein